MRFVDNAPDNAKMLWQLLNLPLPLLLVLLWLFLGSVIWLGVWAGSSCALLGHREAQERARLKHIAQDTMNRANQA
jgi:hypothetical protein